MKIEAVMCDMDGVLADLITAMCRVHDKDPASVDLYGLMDVWSMTESELWDPIDSDEEFWCNIEPYPWFDVLVEMLRKVAPITIATYPRNHWACAHGKLGWLKKHFGEDFDSYMIGRRKDLMGYNPRHLLVDDHEDNVHAFRKAGGQAILFPAPWNDLRFVDQQKKHMEYMIYELQRILDK